MKKLYLYLTIAFILAVVIDFTVLGQKQDIRRSGSNSSGGSGNVTLLPFNQDIEQWGFTNYLQFSQFATNNSVGLRLPYWTVFSGGTNLGSGDVASDASFVISSAQFNIPPGDQSAGGVTLSASAITNWFGDTFSAPQGVFTLNSVFATTNAMADYMAYFYIVPQLGTLGAQEMRSNEVLLAVSPDYHFPYVFSLTSAGVGDSSTPGTLARAGINTTRASAWLEVGAGLLNKYPMQKWSHNNGTNVVAQMEYDGSLHTDGTLGSGPVLSSDLYVQNATTGQNLITGSGVDDTAHSSLFGVEYGATNGIAIYGAAQSVITNGWSVGVEGDSYAVVDGQESTGVRALAGTAVPNASKTIGVRVLDGTTFQAGSSTNNWGIKVEDQTLGKTNYAIQTGLGQVSFGAPVETRNTTTTPTGAQLGVGGGAFWCSNAVVYVSFSTDGSSVTTKQIAP